MNESLENMKQAYEQVCLEKEELKIVLTAIANHKRDRLYDGDDCTYADSYFELRDKAKRAIQ